MVSKITYTKKYFMQTSLTRQSVGKSGLGSVAVSGPFNLVNKLVFLAAMSLMEIDLGPSRVTCQHFLCTNGMLCDTCTNGFGGMVVVAKSNGLNYTGDILNITL